MPLPQLLSLVEIAGESSGSFSPKCPHPPTRKEHRWPARIQRCRARRGKALDTRHPEFFVVVNDDVAGAERWLTDRNHPSSRADAVAFYPPRESFGEAEAHAEIAGGKSGDPGAHRSRWPPDSHRHQASPPRAHPSSPGPCLRADSSYKKRVILLQSENLACAPRGDRLRARADGGGRRPVQRARRNLRHLQLWHGGAGAPRVLGRRHLRAPPLRPL